jgi:hypothetical protein
MGRVERLGCKPVNMNSAMAFSWPVVLGNARQVGAELREVVAIDLGPGLVSLILC